MLHRHDAQVFLFTNVLFCFLEPAIVRRLGLRGTVTGAGALMAVGCLLRSGVPLLQSGLPPYAEVVAGTVLVGAAQPFFQCTPPLLSATWFGSGERALATAIAINFNQVGIATAFLIGGEMAGSADGLSEYFGMITVASFVVAAGAFLQFRERPPTPPTVSAAARLKAEADPNAPPPENFLVTARKLLATPGFLPPLCAFVASIGVSNVVSAFIEDSLHHAGFVEQQTIDLAGTSIAKKPTSP
jgi:MFS family permease